MKKIVQYLINICRSQKNIIEKGLFRYINFLLRRIPNLENWHKRQPCHLESKLTNDRLVDLDFIHPIKEINGRLAIHLHIYYFDAIDEFADLLRNMPFSYDLFISTPFDEIIQKCQKIYRCLPKLEKLTVRKVENRGRDIGPLLCMFGDDLKQYTYFAHLHSKKSLYNKGATRGWGEYLGSYLLGSEGQIRKIFTLLQKDKPYGIVYPQNYYLLPYWANTWLGNESLGRVWCKQLGISSVPSGYFDYPAGSMFWARVDAISPLFEAKIKLDDFPKEAGQTDGTLAHTIERILGLCPLEQGFQIAIIKDKNFPSWSPWRLDQYINHPYEAIVQLLRKPTIKLIAFDIFDTLILRHLLNPETIKEIVAKKVEPSIGDLYLKYRNIAEHQARQIKGKDVGIREIYSQLGKIANISEANLSILMELEINTELSFVEKRPVGTDLFFKALATNKPIVLISDMFLPREIIEACLRKIGISGWHSLFLSNEVGVRKDTGELYHHVLKQFSIAANEMLMVGDSERSDVQIPSDMGAYYIHLMRPVELAKGLPRLRRLVSYIDNYSSEDRVNDEILLAMIINKNYASLENKIDFESIVIPDPYYLGYSLVGPLLLYFVNWLLETAVDDQIEHFYFLSREGKIIKSVYDEWCMGRVDVPKSDYLVLSRRAASVPAITSFSDILNIAKVDFCPNTIEDFLFTRYGLKLSNEKWSYLATKLDWNPSRIVEVQDGNIENLVPLLREVEEDIFCRSQEEREGILSYLSGFQMKEGKNPAVIDIGYSGSVQGYLNKLLGERIHGYYIMTSENSRNVSEVYDVIAKGCYYHRINKSSNIPIMYKLSFELEKMLIYNDPQVQFYSVTNNHVKGVTRELSDDEKKSLYIQKAIQRGVLDFVNDAHRLRASLGESFQFSRQIVVLLWEEFLNNLSSKENKILSDIAIDDYYCGRGIVH